MLRGFQGSIFLCLHFFLASLLVHQEANSSTAPNNTSPEAQKIVKVSKKLHLDVAAFSKTTGIPEEDCIQLLTAAAVKLPINIVFKEKLANKFEYMTDSEKQILYKKAQKYADSHNIKGNAERLMHAILAGIYIPPGRTPEELLEVQKNIRADLKNQATFQKNADLLFEQAKRLRKALNGPQKSNAEWGQLLFERVSKLTGSYEKAGALLNSTNVEDLAFVNGVIDQMIHEEVERMKSDSR